MQHIITHQILGMNIAGNSGAPPPPGGGKGVERGQRPRGTHVSKACDQCRKKKSKCDGQRPVCAGCSITRTPEACSWDGHDGRRGHASEISALQERVTALEGALQALVRHFGSIDNVIHVLQNTTPITASSGGHTQPSLSGSAPGVADSAGNNPSRLHNAASPSQSQNGGGVYLAVPSTSWSRERSSSTSSTDSGFASEASSVASSSIRRSFAPSPRVIRNPGLSVSIPGGFDQTSITPAPAPTPSPGVPTSASNNLSPPPFTLQPDPQSGGGLGIPVQPCWNHPHTPATPSSGSSLSSWASINAASIGQSFASPIRSPQNPMQSPQYPMLSPMIPNAVNQVPPTRVPQPTPSPDLLDSAAGYPSSPHYPHPPGFEVGGGIYLPVPMTPWDRESSASPFSTETPSMVPSTSQHPSGWPAAHTAINESAQTDITMTVESPDDPPEHINMTVQNNMSVYDNPMQQSNWNRPA